MTTGTKTVHTISEMIPSDYEFIGECDPYDCSPAFERDDWFADNGCAHEQVSRDLIDASRCVRCNHKVLYWAIFRHKPSGEAVIVGRDCAETANLNLDSDAARIYQINIAATQRRKMRAEFASEHAELLENMDALRADDFVSDLLSSIEKRGHLTDKQMYWAHKKVTDLAKFVTTGASCEITPASAAPIGKGQTVEGVVLKLEHKENSFGTRFVMTVKSDDGWACWGTVPSSISGGICKGDRIRFVATLEASDKPSFAFTKRPRKAKILQSAKENDTQEESPEARYFRDMELQASHRHDDHYGTNTQFEYSENMQSLLMAGRNSND